MEIISNSLLTKAYIKSGRPRPHHFVSLEHTNLEPLALLLRDVLIVINFTNKKNL